jgi:hypothetical protein
MPALFKLLTLLFENYISEKFNLSSYEKLFTFLNGFISSLIGIFIGEKAKIMTFIILSVWLRSMHSLLVVFLSKNGYKTSSKLVTWFIFFLACFGFLFLNFYHSSFRPVSKLFEGYALYQGNESYEVESVRRQVKLV